MSGIALEKEEIKKYAKLLGFGFYRVTPEGQFVECDAKARQIFAIPQGEDDLSKYSIKEMYTAPSERQLRVKRLMENIEKPLNSTLSLRIDGESKILFDICWNDDSYTDGGHFFSFISEIEQRTMFPMMFETLPVGFYEVDDEDRVVNVNERLVDILKYNDKEKILKRHIKEFFEDEEKLRGFNNAIQEQGFAHDILRLKDANDRAIDVECFSQLITKLSKTRWGMITDVSERMRYIRALEKMPTGYYYIEHGKGEYDYEQERLTQCNDRLVEILGFSEKEEVIGENMVKLFHREQEVHKKFLDDLYEADRKGEPLQNYIFKSRRISDREIRYLSVDVHLVKDRHGKVIGREGTVRDISEEIELRDKVKETEERLGKTTADINTLIHTFLHPVIKFAGNSELFKQAGNLLYRSLRQKTSAKIDLRELGQRFEDNLEGIRYGLEDISALSEDAAFLVPTFKKIVNVYDYNLRRAENSKRLFDNAIRDAALWVLEELARLGFFNENFRKGRLGDVITDKFIAYLQDVLFGYLIRTAGILKGETIVMKREVEALRRYIVGKEKKYRFKKRDLRKILEENIEIFNPILAQKDIEIEHKITGNLFARISENDIDRVICNLLHNAYKYSLPRPGRVVKIRAKELQAEKAVQFIISSFGIPIKKNELESGAIFKFGYRGKLVYQTDRDGTGVGLADAKEVIDAHGGKITIESNPVGNDGDPPKYEVPYITAVTVKLPKTKPKHKRENRK